MIEGIGPTSSWSPAPQRRLTPGERFSLPPEPAPGGESAGESADALQQAQPDAPKLESMLVGLLLKEAKLFDEQDARSAVALESLTDLIVDGGDFDLGLGPLPGLPGPGERS